MYNGATRQVGRTFSRFKDIAYSGVFRSDGRLLAAGGQDGVVQVSMGHGIHHYKRQLLLRSHQPLVVLAISR